MTTFPVAKSWTWGLLMLTLLRNNDNCFVGNFFSEMVRQVKLETLQWVGCFHCFLLIWVQFPELHMVPQLYPEWFLSAGISPRYYQCPNIQKLGEVRKTSHWCWWIIEERDTMSINSSINLEAKGQRKIIGEGTFFLMITFSSENVSIFRRWNEERSEKSWGQCFWKRWGKTQIVQIRGQDRREMDQWNTCRWPQAIDKLDESSTPHLDLQTQVNESKTEPLHEIIQTGVREKHM